MNQQERSRRTREQVLDAAAEEFARHGYADAAVQSVAARTGMTKGALYGHFPSKERLAGALVAVGAQSWARLLAESQLPGTAPLTALRAITVGLAHALREDERLRAAVRLENDGLIAGTGDGGLLGDMRRAIVSVVLRGQDEGEVTSGYRAETIAQLLLSVVLGAQSAAALTRDSSFEPWLERVWELVLAMIRGCRSHG
ncbi:TetR/AcrR family transcriptional regulator [Streptomyces sp. NPDC052000]|uniref:TetR/AcrR family transcriptional regulator n=1 Tax=Streptomyces sp. NPDC052000 TaxID=3155676 RepID=UPI00344B92C3